MGAGAGETQFARAVPGSASQIPPVQLDTPPGAIRLAGCVRRGGSDDVRACAGLDLKTHLKVLYSERCASALSRFSQFRCLQRFLLAAELTQRNWYRYLEHQCEDQEADGENARSHAQLRQRGIVFVDLPQGIGRQAWDDESHALFDVDRSE